MFDSEERTALQPWASVNGLEDYLQTNRETPGLTYGNNNKSSSQLQFPGICAFGLAPAHARPTSYAKQDDRVRCVYHTRRMHSSNMMIGRFSNTKILLIMTGILETDFTSSQHGSHHGTLLGLFDRQTVDRDSVDGQVYQWE